MKRRAIPTLQTGNIAVDDTAAAVKHNIDMVTGQHGNAPALVAIDPATATTAQLAALVNTLIKRIQGDA